jgi:hypothetical protein
MPAAGRSGRFESSCYRDSKRRVGREQTETRQRTGRGYSDKWEERRFRDATAAFAISHRLTKELGLFTRGAVQESRQPSSIRFVDTHGRRISLPNWRGCRVILRVCGCAKKRALGLLGERDGRSSAWAGESQRAVGAAAEGVAGDYQRRIEHSPRIEEWALSRCLTLPRGHSFFGLRDCLFAERIGMF